MNVEQVILVVNQLHEIDKDLVLVVYFLFVLSIAVIMNGMLRR